ncbi:hypothetical protein [Nocardia gipuzkoensis]|uniref:hypothetical protein n=1 Tax=Nocardia gipuzkoensis TaxID=2749991 RepID=UPI003EE0D502
MLFTSPAGADNWIRTSSIQAGVNDRTQLESARHADTVWIWTFGSAGAKLVDGRWSHWTRPCLGPDERLDAVRAPTGRDLVALCESRPVDTPSKIRYRLLVSHDAGETFADRRVPEALKVALIGAATADDIVVEADGAIVTSHDGGQRWTQTYKPADTGGLASYGDFSIGGDDWPGFVTPTDGFVMETRQFGAATGSSYRREQSLLATHDAGRTWTRIAFTDLG